MPKNLRLMTTAAIIIAAVGVAFLTYSPKEEITVPKCGVYRHDKTVTINAAEIKAEVVKTAAELKQGLSGRPCIEPDQGMLFVFNRPGYYAFWMKDMRFPIDIVWIGADYRVVGLEIDVAPSTYPDRFVNKDKPAQYVLELSANRSKDLKIDLGTPVKFD